MCAGEGKELTDMEFSCSFTLKFHIVLLKEFLSFMVQDFVPLVLCLCLALVVTFFSSLHYQLPFSLFKCGH
jgi:hypothetical protein